MIGQFLLYNLLPSLVVGLLAWAFVTFGLKVFPIEDPRLRLGFLSLPAIKSTLVLLGWQVMLPWPASLFDQILIQAVPWRQLWPFLLGWAAILTLVYLVLIHRLRKRLMAGSQPLEDNPGRLTRSLDRVVEKLASQPVSLPHTPVCAIYPLKIIPELRQSETLVSPMALTDGGRPLILWPTGLPDSLTDEEMDAVMAHELGHFILRRRNWCSTTLVRRLTVISPAAALVGAQLNWEEELACDDIASELADDEEAYARALLKSARFAQSASSPQIALLQPLPRLLGSRPLLTRRIERLLAPAEMRISDTRQYASACLLGILTVFLFFSAL